MLNFFWGKSGENLKKPCTTTVNNPAALIEMVSKDLLHMHTVHMCSDQNLEIKNLVLSNELIMVELPP